MTNEELLEYIRNESKGRYKTVHDLRNDHSEYAKNFRKVLSKKIKLGRRKDLESANKLSFKSRFSIIKFSQEDSKQYIHDSITGSIHSQDRMVKKAVKKTLKNPSGRQLRKEKRFLREQQKLNVKQEEV